MSVFKIQQPGINTDNDLNGQKRTLESTSPEATISPAEATASGETSATAPTTPQEGGVPAAASDETGTALGEKKELMIKIDGPVSRVFTDALNKMLVNESYLTMPLPGMMESSSSQHDDDDTANDASILQVYVWKADELNTADVVQITNEVTKHTERDFVIAIESSGHMSTAVGLLGGLDCLKNVSVCFSHERAIDCVKSRLAK